MKTNLALSRLYIDWLSGSRREQKSIVSAVNSLGVSPDLTPSKVSKAFELHKKTGIPLRMALELGTKKSNPNIGAAAITFANKLSPSYRTITGHGVVRIIPSFHIRTRVTVANVKAKNTIGLQKFTSIAFRVIPDQMQARKHSSTKLSLFQETNPYNYVQIFEIGFGRIGKQQVVVVTNAQAIKWFYSLPSSARRIFKEAYDETLNIIRKTAGDTPILIPSNQTVRQMLKRIFGHSPSDKVLDEFYDKFCENRGRKKKIVTIKNPADATTFTGEFWV